MELRIDKLLGDLRSRPEQILAAIDRDPLLRRREIGELVLANASKELFTPQEPHHLFAKGIVYRRNPYRLVSLPLLKIYNLGEKTVTVADIEALARSSEEGVSPRLHFLKKYDGTMIQRFQLDGRVWYSTRGVLEGMSIFEGADDGEPVEVFSHFDYLTTARTLARRQYPVLDEATPAFDDLTLIFELIHPEARVITDYSGREDLILIAVFDQHRWGYFSYAELLDFGTRHGLNVVDAFSPTGNTLADQLDHLMATLAGTDQEGTVLTIEHGAELVYRVKSKSPDYLRLLRLLVHCNYAATAAMLDAFAEMPTWPAFEAFLQTQGTDKVPEEVLGLYREHYERFEAYRHDVGRLRDWALAQCAELKASIEGIDDLRLRRKSFAERVKTLPHTALLFSAFDGRLDSARVREYAATPEEMSAALEPMPND